jgi:hypothetical protein
MPPKKRRESRNKTDDDEENEIPWNVCLSPSFRSNNIFWYAILTFSRGVACHGVPRRAKARH